MAVLVSAPYRGNLLKLGTRLFFQFIFEGKFVVTPVLFSSCWCQQHNLMINNKSQWFIVAWVGNSRQLQSKSCHSPPPACPSSSILIRLAIGGMLLLAHHGTTAHHSSFAAAHPVASSSSFSFSFCRSVLHCLSRGFWSKTDGFTRTTIILNALQWEGDRRPQWSPLKFSRDLNGNIDCTKHLNVY